MSDLKALTHGRIKIRLPKDFKDKDILKKYNDDESFRKEYKIVVDTADNSICLESR